KIRTAAHLAVVHAIRRPGTVADKKAVVMWKWSGQSSAPALERIVLTSERVFLYPIKIPKSGVSHKGTKKDVCLAERDRRIKTKRKTNFKQVSL
ncbi:MAG: hypothetical protein KDD04_09765, partial [Sinomicrobium sp.]|nr:hypothetical protein [Sinomicrobium sp.]